MSKIAEKSQSQYQRASLEALEEIVNEQIRKVEEIDLKSYTSWEEDPDCKEFRVLRL